MSKIEELIQQLCSNGVEWKRLSDVCDFVNGFAFKSNLFKNAGDTIIRITNISGGRINLSDLKYCNVKDYKTDLSQFSVNKGDILIAMSGATTGKIGFYDHDSISYINQRVGKFKPHIDALSNRYLYHFLLSKSAELYAMAGGGAQPNLSSTTLMNNIEIPLPPLPVQEEIVRILDAFTDYTAELQAELQARREQYEYYRNKLLSFEDDSSVVYMTLKEVATIKNGKDYKHLDYGEIPVYGSGGVMTYVNEYTYDKPSVLIPRKGSLGNLFYVDMPFWNVDTIFYTVIDTKCVEPKYLYYVLTKAQLADLNNAGGVPSLTQSILNRVIIPIPPLSEQRRIVAILDKFEALVNDLTEGLPAEIAARQEQYEYYRDKLLSFPKAV